MTTHAIAAPERPARRGTVTKACREFICDAVAVGHGYTRLAKELNRRGFRPREAKSWTPRMVRNFVLSEGIRERQAAAAISPEASARMAELHVAGIGREAIASALDAEGITPPRSENWNKETVRNHLIRLGLYTPRAKKSDAERFGSHTRHRGECVLWDAAVRPDGLGLFTTGGRRVPAHRFAYAMKHGPLGADTLLIRICPDNNRNCVNPEHWRRKGTVQEEFWARTARDTESDCILWQGRVDKDGYGRFATGTTWRPAHRVAYELSSGEALAADTEIHHVCRNRPCVNSAHMLAAAPDDHVAVQRLENAVIAGLLDGGLLKDHASLPQDGLTITRPGRIGSGPAPQPDRDEAAGQA